MPSSGLDLDPDGLRRVAELVRAAGTVLAADLGDDVPACGSDEVSQAIVDNLNARRRWLAEHVRVGHRQALDAADDITGSAVAYSTEDAVAASRYSGGIGVLSDPGVSDVNGTPAVTPALTGLPAISEIPDISGRDGEELALALEAGAGLGPATSAAARCAGLATRAGQAATQLLAAQEALAVSGQSEMHAPLMGRLAKAAAWTQGVAAHAGALASSYTTAAETHAAVYELVGTSASWRMLKNAYNEAIMENQATGGLNEPMVQAYSAALSAKQHQSGSAITGYQVTGQTVSASPGDLFDPNLNPNGVGQPNPAGDPPTTDDLNAKKTKPLTDGADPTTGPQELLSSMLGAVGPMLGAVARANPLQSLDQAAQQLGQQIGKLGGASHPGTPSKATAPTSPGTGAHKGVGAGKGLGAGGIKAGMGGALHPAAAATTPAVTTSPAAAAKSSGAPTRAGAGGGMGMMPMGARRAGDKSPSKSTSKYPDEPLSEIESTGRPGIVADTTKPAPTVDPEAQKAVLDRIARRKKAITGDDA